MPCSAGGAPLGHRVHSLAIDTETIVVLQDALATSPHTCPPQAYLSTSSAWKRSVGGIVRPRAWAVFRLMTNSNFVGCSTGRSAGVAPFRRRST